MGLVGRSLRRRPARTALVGAAVALAVALLVALQSLAAGFLAAQTADVRDRPVDVVLQPVSTRGDLRQTGLGAAGVRDAHRVARDLLAIDGVASASPTLEAILVARGPDGEAVQVIAQGVIPGDHADAMSEAQRARFDGYFSDAGDARWADGRYDGPRADEVAVNSALADRLGVAKGSRLALAPSPTEAARNLTVVGVFESPFTGTGVLGGVHVALLPLAELQELSGVAGRDAASRLALRLTPEARADPDAAAAVVEGLRARFPGFEALTKEDELREARERAAVSAGFYTAVAYVSLAVSALFVASVMVMEVQQRRRDLGVLRAIGWRRASVFRAVAAEALAIVAGGTALGVGLGYFASEALSGYFQRGYGLDVAFTRFTPGLAAASAAQSLAVGVLAALYPAWMASRVDALKVLRTAR